MHRRVLRHWGIAVLAAFAGLVAACEPSRPSTTMVFEVDTAAARKADPAAGDDNLVVERVAGVLERRLAESHYTVEGIDRQGTRIAIRLRGVQKDAALATSLTIPGRLTFQLVDEGADPAGTLPSGDEVLPMDVGNGATRKLAVEKRVLMSGAQLKTADWALDGRTGAAVVTFRFDDAGTRHFAEVSRANIGRHIAIVLDGKIVSAPVIVEPILAGAGQIASNFTEQDAREMAARLRAGALPAPIRLVEIRPSQ